MTAEERREQKIAEIYANLPNWKPSSFVLARMRDAYEAGRSAGLEEAANLMRLEASTNAQGRHFAAAIRALITAPQKT